MSSYMKRVLANERSHKVRKVTFSTLKFERAHGRRPSGDGMWAFFELGRSEDLDAAFWFRGSYSDAKRAARSHFVSLGIVFVEVGS